MHNLPTVRVHKSCVNVTQNVQKPILCFNLTFPHLKSCNWNRRSWYDAIFVGAEADLAVGNSMDFESLAKQTVQFCARFVSDIGSQCSIVAHDISASPKYY